jgi:hypothetical protein
VSPLHRRLAPLLLAAAFSGGAAGAATGPLAIHSPTVFAPPATAGFGIAPEVSTRLAIDARGVVTAVEVLSIAPASELDDLFRDEVVRTLRNWRFAPATDAGAPVASRLELRFQLPAKPAEPLEKLSLVSPLAGADAEERRAAVLALPLAIRRKILEVETRAALRLLEPAKMRDAATARFVVRTDADDERTAEKIAENLEAIFNLLARDLLSGIPLQPEPFKLNVVAYRTRAQYDALATELVPFERSSGYYSPAGLIAFHLEQPNSDYLMSVLLHEATHAFLDRHVVRPGVALPRWLGEGFAEYVGNSAVQKGKLQPGKTFVHKYAIEQGRLLSFETSAGARRDEAQQALRRGQGIGVPQMLEASPDIFYGGRRSLYYASSWLFVHFLRDGGDGAGERFPRLLLYLAEGYPQTAAFRATYGELEPADAAFRQYVKSF